MTTFQYANICEVSKIQGADDNGDDNVRFSLSAALKKEGKSSLSLLIGSFHVFNKNHRLLIPKYLQDWQQV